MGKQWRVRLGIVAAVGAVIVPLALASAPAGAAGSSGCTVKVTSRSSSYLNFCEFNATGTTVTYRLRVRDNGYTEVYAYHSSDCSGDAYYSTAFSALDGSRLSGSFTSTPGDCIYVLAESPTATATASG